MYLIPPPPPGFTFEFKSKHGVYWYSRPNGPGEPLDWVAIHDTQDVLDRNQAMANHNDGWSVEGSKSDKLLRRCATVPWGVIHEWRETLGVDYFSSDPDMQRKVDQLLDSSDWSKLRTAHYRIGKQTQWV